MTRPRVPISILFVRQFVFAVMTDLGFAFGRTFGRTRKKPRKILDFHADISNDRSSSHRLLFEGEKQIKEILHPCNRDYLFYATSINTQVFM